MSVLDERKTDMKATAGIVPAFKSMNSGTSATFLDWFRLNMRVLRLALAGKWLSGKNLERSYDLVAPWYNDTWLKYLRPVTDSLVSRIGSNSGGRILDLGCGTGYTTVYMACRFPEHPVEAVDISGEMLVRARERLSGMDVAFKQADMRDYLRSQSDNSASMIISAWAIGYSRPAEVIHRAARVLKPGGTLAIVVNCRDTLEPVFSAFLQCMALFPEKVRMAAIPRFPKNRRALTGMVTRAGLEIAWREEGFREIPRSSMQGRLLPWLLKTGILAGFDTMLPVTGDGEIARAFEHHLGIAMDGKPLKHHYISIIGRKK